MKEIVLYTTLGCHLCDQAEAMLNHLIDKQLVSGYRLSLIEISEDDSLLELYGIRIPVLAINNDELGWPFDLTELQSWVNTRQE